MTRRWTLGLLIAISCLGPAVTAQERADIPRTPSGKPDFQGVWASRWLSPMERPPGVDRLVVEKSEAERVAAAILERAANPGQMDPELAYPDAETLAIVRGEYRTSLLVEPANGKLPFTEAGRAAARGYVGGLDHPEQRMTTERCIGGVGWTPLQIRTASMLRRFVQTDSDLVVHSEAYSDVRVVPIGETRLPRGSTQHAGVSSSRWDGDALVIETDGFTPHLSTHGIVTVMSPQAKVTERFEFAGPDELVYRYTITDPAYYSEPWTAEFSLTRTSEAIFEFACHEGNYSLTHMLEGARVDERRRGP